MARKRMIDPTIWEDEDFGQLSSEAKLLFIGLFSNADDEGRIRANTAYIKSTIFMYDTLDLQKVDLLIHEVSKTMKSVRLYEVDGKQYVQLMNWNEYQKQHKDRIQESTLPPYKEGVSDNVGQMTDNVGVSKDKLSKISLSKDKLDKEGGEKSPDAQDVKSLEIKKEFGNPSINRAISLLRESGLTVVGEEKQRWAVQRLFKSQGEEKTLQAMKVALSVRGKKYAPVIINYHDLESKWGSLEAYINRELSDQGGVYDATAIS